jgi:hypothetical protein
MALLSTFKSFRKWLPVGQDWQLVSEQTSAKDVIFDDNENLATKQNDIAKQLSGLSFVVLSQAEYNALEVKDGSTLYFIHD